MIDWLLRIASGVGGYLGVFVISVLGNLIPFIPIPYLVAVYLYAALIPGCNPILLGLVSGVGAGFGKLLIYFTSRGVSHIVLSEDTRKRYSRLSSMLGMWGAIAVFLFAATPSPDDVIIVLLGLMGYNPLKFFIGVTAGKVVISILTAYTGMAVAEITGGEFWIELTASIVLFIVVMVVISLIDWEGVLVTLGERGVKGLVDEVKSKGLAAVFFSRKTNKKTRS
ncbi:hypothetical protein IG193_05970 [Infirmifilum lucidum]|uniref:VTT domain-containing protein n=1 Tax=Infirmifilum lucidum TaxID=2776706 RepID=A0A7L9FFA8_9CREN|nr:VTT domain-containing protein [Infirmifilum lucidum]QOJ78311.1 hypothetical protein IG193_05970 [Infirmifilum lucidum]